VTAITVLRVPASLGGTARRFSVLIDGVERARLAGGEEIEVEVSPGKHSIQARIDWTGSEVLEVVVAEGVTASFAIEPAADTRFGQLARTIGRTSFLKLRRISD
jgi:hypothetical protein